MPVNMDPARKRRREPLPPEADSSTSKKEPTVPTQAAQFGEETEEDRVKELADRYGTPLPQIIGCVNHLETRVNAHLERMGFGLSRPKLAEVGS